MSAVQPAGIRSGLAEVLDKQFNWRIRIHDRQAIDI